MHLDHKIPWNLACSHLKVFLPPPPEEQSRFPPRFPGLRARNQSRQVSDLNHFARVLASAIREFSTTERRKYSTEELDSCPSDKVFSDTWRDDYTSRDDILGFFPEMQSFSEWAEARRGGRYYKKSAFADVVKALLDPEGLDAHENMMSLLRLARHPEIYLQDLDYFGRCYQEGIVAIPEVTLQAYIYLNVIGCLPAEQRQKIQTSEWNLRFVHDLIKPNYIHAQQIPHRRFWSHSCRWDANAQQMASIRNLRYSGHIDWFADMKKLTDYLSMCFKMLVRYDCVMRETGVDVDWVHLIIEWTPLPFDKKLVPAQDEKSLPDLMEFKEHTDSTSKATRAPFSFLLSN